MEQEFDWMEYSIFIIMLSISSAIGLYFGCFKGGQDTVEGYLLGGKGMTLFPITMSLIASFISGLTMLGLPTEIYTHGTQIIMSNFAGIVVLVMTATCILPVFYKLQLISLFEYMEMRFDHRVRKIASLIYILDTFTFVATVIYGPALALNQVSHMNVHVITPIICTVCIFYTTLGGFKAVVWSDTIQCVCMVVAVIFVMILGLVRVGGFEAVYEAAVEGDRLEFFNMNPDPTVRLTFWTTTMFITDYLVVVPFTPECIQRFTSLPTLRQAKIAAVLFVIGILLIRILSGFIGLILYAEFKGCDPLRSQLIRSPDQILPHFVFTAVNFRGFPGLFLAGIVCAALSTMSTSLNTAAGTFYRDLIEPFLKKKPTQKQASLIIKFLVVLFGASCTYLVTIVEQLGAIYEIYAGFGGVTKGTMAGLFILGLFFPTSNAIGALVGGCTSLCAMTWLLIGSSNAKINGFVHPTKALTVENCTHAFNATELSIPDSNQEVFYLFRLSFFVFEFIGSLIVITVGLLVSHMTGSQNLSELNPKFVSPIVRRFLPKIYINVPLKDKE